MLKIILTFCAWLMAAQGCLVLAQVQPGAMPDPQQNPTATGITYILGAFLSAASLVAIKWIDSSRATKDAERERDEAHRERDSYIRIARRYKAKLIKAGLDSEDDPETDQLEIIL